MKDIPARRMATVIEFALTIAIGFHFLARRYGAWVGVVMAGSLLLMPRLYGEAHLIDTDTPGLLIWAATALAFWKGLYEPDARRWRVFVGILMGLAFVEKMGVVMVLLPLLGWLAASRFVPALLRPSRADWIDGLVTTGLMLAPLALAFQQIQLLQRQFPPPDKTNLLIHRPVSDWPGAILAIPMAVWLIRRGLERLFRGSPVWGVERPALETWTAILAFAPLVGWLGNPAWWRETLPRLTHYYMLNTDREGALPRIQIMYFGQLYEYSLPWHNAFVLLAITVPVAILAAAVVGLMWGLLRIRRDRLPFYFLVHLLTLPVIRMFPTPAHDGVRLFLPTFFFLAAFAGWGTIWLADSVARVLRLAGRPGWVRLALAGAVLGSSAFALVRVHPYELSYYNELVGGPRGAWEKGFELSYWYDAFNGPVLDELNRRLPPNAQVDFLNDLTRTSVPVFPDQQSLGLLRGDLILGWASAPFPYVWLLTQDSKATAFTRLLFAMHPWYASEPRQLDGARVASVYDPRGGLARLGPVRPARCPRPQSARSARGAGLGAQARAVAQASLGRRVARGVRRERAVPVQEGRPAGRQPASAGLVTIRSRRAPGRRPPPRRAAADRRASGGAATVRPHDGRGPESPASPPRTRAGVVRRPPRGPGGGRPDPERPPRRGRQGHDSLRLHRSDAPRRLPRSRPALIVAVARFASLLGVLGRGGRQVSHGGLRLGRRQVLASIGRDAAGDRQGDDVDPASGPVRCGGRDAAEEDIRDRVTDHAGERLRRAVRTEDGALLAIGSDP